MVKKIAKIKLGKKIIEAEVEVLPPGICKGAIETFVEKHISSRITGMKFSSRGRFTKNK